MENAYMENPASLQSSLYWIVALALGAYPLALATRMVSGRALSALARLLD